MDRGAWQATVHGVTKSRTRLSNGGIAVTGVIVIIIAILGNKENWEWSLDYFKHLSLTLNSKGSITTNPQSLTESWNFPGHWNSQM